MSPLEIAMKIRAAYPGASGVGLEAADTIERMYSALVVAKSELDELEGAIDRQTSDEHQRAGYDMPDDAELHIVLTVKDERRLARALRMLYGAVAP
jgi:hypothetical protein